MFRYRKVVISLVISLFIVGGCISGISLPKIKMQRKQAKQAEPVVEKQMQRDIMRPLDKAQTGVHVDKSMLTEDVYNPNTLSRRISSSGHGGLTRQTFAEAGGDYNVHLDLAGKKMAFSTTRYSSTPQICVQSVRGKAVKLLTEDNMSDMMPKFSPQGDLVAWCSDRYGNWDILVQREDARPDSRPMQITRATDDDVHPTWSIDQKLLAFSRFNTMDGKWQIWVLDYNNRTLSYVTEGLFPEFCPTPEEDGYTLVYQRHRRRDVPWYSIWTTKVKMTNDGVVEALGAPQEIIASDKWAAITPSWSPDGKYIAFASVRKSPLTQYQGRIYKADDIWVVKANGTDLAQITSHSAPDWNPCWAVDENNPNGGRIYFTSLRSGHANVWSVKPLVAGMIAGE